MLAYLELEDAKALRYKMQACGKLMDEAPLVRQAVRCAAALERRWLGSRALQEAMRQALADALPAPLRSACNCLLYTSPSPRDRQKCRMPSSA